MSAAEAAHNKAYPVPAQGLVLTAESCGTVQELLSMFATVTGESLIYSNDTKALLESRETGLQENLTIAPEDVYATVQDILTANRVVLSDLSRTTPRMLLVESTDTNRRSSLRENARFVPASELEAYSRDSAIMISTVLSLPNCNTRAMSNTLRMLVVDANTTQIMAVNETSSFVLTGRAAAVNTIAKMLYAMEDEAAASAARRKAEEEAKAASEAPAKSSKN